jgi:uncharacterized protein YcbX
MNGKRTPKVHLLRSRIDPNGRSVAFETPNMRQSFQIDSDRPQLESWLSNFFGVSVTLVENTDSGFPDDTNAPGPTVISTATLREVASWFPGLGLDEARLRFRANLEIDGVEPFWEDRLYGEQGQIVQFEIGDTLFEGVNPCQRCVVPTRSPLSGEADSEFAKTFAERRQESLPEWVTRSRFDHYYRLAVNTRGMGGGIMRLGDEVKIREW